MTLPFYLKRLSLLLELLPKEKILGKRILLPRAKKARDVLPQTLQKRGGQVDLVPIYETVLPDPQKTKGGLKCLEEGTIDVLTFTSASTVENFATILGPRLDQLCAGKVIVAIGPITKDACHRIGLQVNVMPETYTVAAMVDALIKYFHRQGGL